jgi:hypothetical protein
MCDKIGHLQQMFESLFKKHPRACIHVAFVYGGGTICLSREEWDQAEDPKVLIASRYENLYQELRKAYAPD